MFKLNGKKKISSKISFKKAKINSREIKNLIWEYIIFYINLFFLFCLCIFLFFIELDLKKIF